MIETKICTKCKEDKPLCDFTIRNNRKSGIQSQCKKCKNSYPKNRSANYTKNYDLIKSYGITLEEYNSMLEEQNGCCKICNKSFLELQEKNRKVLCVDHCHTTGKVRGLLCNGCNTGLGFFKDDVNLLLRAIDYLA